MSVQISGTLKVVPVSAILFISVVQQRCYRISQNRPDTYLLEGGTAGTGSCVHGEPLGLDGAMSMKQLYSSVRIDSIPYFDWLHAALVSQSTMGGM